MANLFPAPMAPGEDDFDESIPLPEGDLAHIPVPEPTIDLPAASHQETATQHTRSGRAIRPPQRYGMVAWELLIDQESEESPTAQEQFRLQHQLDDPIAFAASNDPDVLYYHQAMQASDRREFQKAVEQEIAGHVKGKHWVEIPLSEVPPGTRILDSVWAMRRKRKLDTREVYKWKARLNVHGGQQEHGINYWETYAPVVAWPVIRFFFTLSILFGWHSRQLDFVMAFPQAPIEVPLYMKIPPGYQTQQGNPRNRVLKLLRNLYGQKQGPRVWNRYLEKSLRELGFEQSKIFPCLFYRRDVAMLIYVDDCILFSPSSQSIDQVITELKKAPEKYTLEDQGEVNEFLGIQVQATKEGLSLTQPHLIASILEDLGLQANSKSRETPALSTSILHKDETGEPMNKDEFHYRSVVGKLNFLEKSTRPDIAYAVHQCARFSEAPKESHANALKLIGRYLQGTKNKGIIMKPNGGKSFECWADADFSGNWQPETAHKDPTTAKSRSGWIITYANCPITWASKLQTLTALSTTEAEYIALSNALRDQIPLMDLLKEVSQQGVGVQVPPARIYCKAFEDNAGALELARIPKIRPRTKHINVCYHHFREHVENGLIEVHHVPSDEQLADLLTKPLAVDKLQKIRKRMLHW